MAPLHLRMANLRRWLDKRTNTTDHPILSHTQTVELFKIIQNQRIPLVLKNDANGAWEVIVQERPAQMMETCIHEWYVLDCNFRSASEARIWCNYAFRCSEVIIN